MVRVHQPTTPLPTRLPSTTPWPSDDVIERMERMGEQVVDTITEPSISLFKKFMMVWLNLLRRVINGSNHPELFRLLFKLILIGLMFVCLYMVVVRLVSLATEVSRKLTGWPRKIKEF